MYGIHSATVVGYTADADVWCPDCAREVYGDVDDPAATDGEGNPFGAIFADSESGDSPSHCNRCGEFIDDSWSPSCVEYAIEALRDYIITPGIDEGGRADVLDVWADNLTWCGKDDEQAVIIDIYFDLRHAERRDHR